MARYTLHCVAPSPATKGQRLAEAIELVALVDHYMIDVVEPFTRDELDDAEQIIIDVQNSLRSRSQGHKRLDLALNMIELVYRRKCTD